MDRYTAAALGQNLTSAFSDIGQMFDPRLRGQADQQRLANEGLQLQNAGLGIKNQFLPQQLQANLGLTGAQTGSANAAAKYSLAGVDLRNSQTAGYDLKNNATQMMLDGIPDPNAGPLTIDTTGGSVNYKGQDAPPVTGGQLSPQQQLERNIILATVTGNNPYLLAQAYSSNKAQNAATATEMDQGLSGQGKQPYLATTAMDNQSAQQIAAGNAQMDLIGGLFPQGSGTRRGDGSMLGVPKTAPSSYTDATKVEGEAISASFDQFGVALDGDGNPKEDPYAEIRRPWVESYRNAKMQGASSLDARATANEHHFGTDNPEINSEDTFRFGFGKDPFMPKVVNKDPLQPPSPSQAFGAAQNPEDLAAIIQQIPQLYGIPVQTPRITQAGVPATGIEPQGSPKSLMNPQPEEIPQRPARISDQFKLKNSSEAKAKKEKAASIGKLEEEIKSLESQLKAGEVTAPIGRGPIGTASIYQTGGRSKLTDDQYDVKLKKLQDLESKLENLKGTGNQAGQGDVSSRYSVVP